MKRNQWYSRTVDDILPELADLKYFSLLDVKSGYWHVSTAFFRGNLTPARCRMDPKKVQAITEMKPPENLQDLQSFLGLVKYLNRFSPALAGLTAPLRMLCKKDTLFTWESSQQTENGAIKKEITIAPVLAYFGWGKASTIQSDTSKKGLGAVLIQGDKPVIYAPRALTETEQSYSNIERELLSVVFCS